MRQLYASLIRRSCCAVALLAVVYPVTGQACPIRIAAVETKFVEAHQVIVKRIVEKVLKPAFQDWEGPSYVDAFDWKESPKSQWQMGRASTSSSDRYKPKKLDLVLEIDEGLDENETSVSISFWSVTKYEDLLNVDDVPIAELQRIGSTPKLQKYLAGLRKRCR